MRLNTNVKTWPVNTNGHWGSLNVHRCKVWSACPAFLVQLLIKKLWLANKKVRPRPQVNWIAIQKDWWWRNLFFCSSFPVLIILWSSGHFLFYLIQHNLALVPASLGLYSLSHFSISSPSPLSILKNGKWAKKNQRRWKNQFLFFDFWTAAAKWTNSRSVHKKREKNKKSLSYWLIYLTFILLLFIFIDIENWLNLSIRIRHLSVQFFRNLQVFFEKRIKKKVLQFFCCDKRCIKNQNPYFCWHQQVFTI